MDDELLLLATHGVLHILGYDHMEPDEEKEMFGLQSELLAKFAAVPRDQVTGEETAPRDELHRDHPAGDRRPARPRRRRVRRGRRRPAGDLPRPGGDAAARDGVRRAAALLDVVEDRARHVSLLLLVRIACEMTAAVLIAVILYVQFDGVAAGVVTAAAVMTVVSYVLVGVGPRTLGRQHAYSIALAAAGPTRLLGRLLGPVSTLLILLGNAITPGRGFRDGPFSTEVELRELVDIAEERGVVESGERNMIQSVFSLGDTIAREVMVPRPTWSTSRPARTSARPSPSRCAAASAASR